MKIGIFTIFDAYNYGSFLQAFAMQCYLESRGHDVYVIDIRQTIKSVISQKYFAKSIYRTILKLRRFIKYRVDWKKLHIESFKNYPSLDLAIIGSDEVWNIENPSFDHSVSFYGKDIRADKIIAYAPSLGYSNLESYNGHQELIKEIKKNISWFGVRDQFTKDFLTQIGISKVNTICDPTILLHSEWRKYEKEIKELPPYIVYYSYKEDSPYKELIKQFAKEKGLKIISVGFDYKWCDNQMIVSPLQFLSTIRNAEYIITSTFHGTLFSVMYEKKFIDVEPARKATDFLNQIKLERTASDPSNYIDFTLLLESEINYDIINERLNNLCDISKDKLIHDIMI